MYVVKITRSIKARGKRPEAEYKFIGELTDEVRKQWQRIFSHAEAGIRYELMTFAEYDNYLKEKEQEK